MFGVKDQPEHNDSLLDLLPTGTQSVPVINPGFEFTLNGGEKPGKNYWIIVPKRGESGYIQGDGQGKMSDHILGWTAHLCAGLESGRPKTWGTPPDGVTGYAIARGVDYYLHQTLPATLKPNTRYTMLIEVFRRNDFKRATADEIILQFADANGEPLDAAHALYDLTPASKTTGFSACLVSLTTHADQPPGDLMLKIGLNPKGSARINFDNVRLWQQPMKEPAQCCGD